MASFSVAVLRLRDFRLLMLTRAFSMTALQSQAVIVGWQIYSLTHSTFLLGLAGLTEAIPAIFCALFAGHIVDISRPHRVYLYCIGVLTLNNFTLFMLAGGLVPVPHLVRFLFACIFISGLARSFIMPSSFSLLPQIVPRPQISSASAWLSTGFQFAAICGPALAGIIYGGYGPRIAWGMPVSLMTGAFIMLLSIGMRTRSYKSAEKREPAVQSIKAGWKFILHNQTLLNVMTLDMFAVLFGGAVAMLPAYADQVLHTGSQGLGILRAAPAAGAILSALTLSVFPFKHIRASVMFWAVAGFGLCMVGFGLSTMFWLSVFFLALSGTFDSISMVIRATLMQLLTPDTMRGRVSAVNSMFIISSNEIGAFESGLAATWLGLVPSVALGGLASLLVVAVMAGISPKLRKLVVDADQENKA